MVYDHNEMYSPSCCFFCLGYISARLGGDAEAGVSYIQAVLSLAL